MVVDRSASCSRDTLLAELSLLSFASHGRRSNVFFMEDAVWTFALVLIGSFFAAYTITL